MVNTFESIEDLASHVAISACVPFFTKLSPWVYYKGERLCDGGFTGFFLPLLLLVLYYTMPYLNVIARTNHLGKISNKTTNY